MQYASLSTSQLAAWAKLNSIELRGIKIEHDIIEQGNSKGGGIIATTPHNEQDAILFVPHDIVVSKQQITDCLRADTRLRELFEALADDDLIKVRRRTLFPELRWLIVATYVWLSQVSDVSS